MPCTRWTVVLSVLLGAVFSLSCLADSRTFEQLTLRNGLSQSTVFAITQDETGFIWLGTRDGLNRFDAYSFEHYRDLSQLPSTFIWSLYSKGNTLWLGTQGAGLIKRTPDSQFVALPNSPAVIVDIQPGHHKSGIWLASQDQGLQFYDFESSTFVRQNPRGSNSVWSVLEDNANQLWIGTADQGLSRFDLISRQWKHYRHIPGSDNSLSSDAVWKVIKDSSGHIWAGTFGGGLNMLQPGTDQFTQYKHSPNDPHSLSNNHVWTLLEDSLGRLWVGTNNGLNLFDKATQQFTHYLPGSQIKSIFEDDAGIIWVGTYYNGVFRLDEQRSKFELLNHDNNQVSALPVDTVNSIFEASDSSFWVGSTGGGVTHFSPDMEQAVYYTHSAIDPNSLSNNHVMSLAEMADGSMLIGTYSGGLNRLSPDKSTITRYLPDQSPHSIADDTVFSILIDKQQRIWLATWRGGINQFHPETGTFSYFQHDTDDPNSLGDNYVQTLFEDRRGRLWAGTASAGLNRFLPDEQRVIRYPHDPNDPYSVNHNHIYSIAEADDGKLWVGTEAGGLNLFNPQTGRFERLMDHNNFLNSAILGILQDKRGLLWLSTRNGLVRFNPRTHESHRYDEGDGVQSREFIAGSYLRDSAGRFYFGGVEGINRFYPDQIIHNQRIPPVLLTKLRVLNTQTSREIDLVNRKEVTLGYNEQPFALEFAALNYTRSDLNRYTYRIKKLDGTWLPESRRREAVYHHIAPGSYLFEVMASNNDGVWNSLPATLTIRIENPWWLSPQAYTAYLFTLFLLGYILWHWRHQALKAASERDIAQRSEHAKQEFLAKMSHEIRTPLSGMLGMGVLLERTNLDTQQKRYVKSLVNAGHSLLRIINDILDFAKIEADKLQLNEKPFNLHQLISELIELFRIEADRRGLQLKLEYSSSLPTSFIGDGVRLRQVLSNLIGNAVKFTEQGGIYIRVSGRQYDQYRTALTISIVDSGIGIDGKRLRQVYEQFEQADLDIQNRYGGTGLGLSIAKQLTELMHGELTLDSELGVGTTANLSLTLVNASEIHDEQPCQGLDTYRNSARVLVAEDNDINAMALSHLLADFGCQVHTLTDGHQVLEYLKDHSADLIFMDRHMPVMDGITATRLIRQQLQHREIPIIALTASVSLRDKEACLEVGMNEYLMKPLLRETTCFILRKYCATHHEQGLPDCEGDCPSEANCTAATSSEHRRD